MEKSVLQIPELAIGGYITDATFIIGYPENQEKIQKPERTLFYKKGSCEHKCAAICKSIREDVMK